MTTYEVAGKKFIQDSCGNLIAEENINAARQKISTPKELMPFLSNERKEIVEQVILFTLDGGNKMIAKHIITRGLVNETQMHPREVFRSAILDNAVSIILVHNHPSGGTEPSEADLIATRRMSDVSKTIGIPLLDHVIITALEFTSIREKYPSYFY